MAVDTPARIAVLGAGPIGLEAAIYARFLGYDVTIIERGEVAENVQRWGHVCLFSPFSMNHSSLGAAAIAAQGSQNALPKDEELLTGHQWRERYLLPLSETDLLSDHLCTNTRVLSLGRPHVLKADLPGVKGRDLQPFQILLQTSNGVQSVMAAEIVIDTTGVYGNPNWVGRGGMPAVGETLCRDRIQFGLPDLSTVARKDFAGKHTLVVGAGYSAATNVVALSELSESFPETRVTWITRKVEGQTNAPLPLIENDQLSERHRLARAANALCVSSASCVTHLFPASVLAVDYVSESAGFRVALDCHVKAEIECDQILANVGNRPDTSLFQELQVHQCYATEGPMKVAASLLAQDTQDCLNQPAIGAHSLLNPEPNFYVLGAKSYGRNSNFLFSLGLDQIRELFSVIGDRTDLDLYAGAKPLLP